MMSQPAVLQLAVNTGEILLKNGAEIYRVQETIDRILRAFAIDDYNIYIVSNGIFVSIGRGSACGEGGQEGFFAMRNVPATAFHLGRIVEANDISRAIVQDPSPDQIADYQRRLEACAAIPHFPGWLQMLCVGVGSAGFCFLLGGMPGECLAAFACGILLQIFKTFYGKNAKSRFMDTLLGAALVSSIAVGIHAVFGMLSLDSIIIGAIISLVPGVALTTSIRDFFNGDFLSGNIHLIDALLTGICIAVGVGAALSLWRMILGGAL